MKKIILKPDKTEIIVIKDLTKNACIKTGGNYLDGYAVYFVISEKDKNISFKDVFQNRLIKKSIEYSNKNNTRIIKRKDVLKLFKECQRPKKTN